MNPNRRKSPAARQINDSMQNDLNTLFLLGVPTAVYRLVLSLLLTLTYIAILATLPIA